MTGEMINAIVGAYDHARRKHPYFCDMITGLSETSVDFHLLTARNLLATATHKGNVAAVDVLMCEFYEMLHAYVNGATAYAVTECYDAIAVLLRTVDVLEGRQPLGNPAKRGGAK